MKRLTKAEEEIMQLIWQAEEATVSQLITMMDIDPRPPHSSISSIVRILQKKDFVDYKAYGRTHVYFPLVKKEEYSKSSLSKLVSGYFNGSIENLVSFLVEQEEIDKEELQALIDQLEK